MTTYEVTNMEKKSLSRFPWQYLIIDEAHRLKNEASIFATTVRQFNTRYRLLLTGTPLQNNLHELWALLNFLLPDIFSSAEQFDEWFNLGVDDVDAKKTMIDTLHKILRPFMLRRLKSDVAKGLPPKTETVLMVGMSSMQKELYKKLLLRDIDSIVGGSKTSEAGKTAVLNILMQLRKCCGHPYLFQGVEDLTLDPMGDHVIKNCGKFVLLDKLLAKLKERGNRVLIFTQMTRILDILEDYMRIRGYLYCRIDGNTDYEQRGSSIEAFNAPNSEKFVFLLSTRAGGLGINLQTADTVVLYDSDWNPQSDLQAQDRAHRIGQKKPVHVYRLVTENTVEEKIVERAQQKLKLDAMVVQSGRLKEKDKVSKDDLMAAIKFGADQVFRSTASDITDDDIDAILARGEEKTKEMEAKLEKADKGDLLNFSFDTGLATQTFEGVDYSDKAFRDQLKLMHAEGLGKRERKPTSVPLTYDHDPVPTKVKKTMMVKNMAIKIPRHFRLPKMDSFMLYDQKRLRELNELEFEAFAALREQGVMPSQDQLAKMDSILPPDLADEKKKLLAEGFPMINKRDYFRFIRGLSMKGKDNMEEVASEVGMTLEVVEAYNKRFWEVGESLLGQKEWARISKQIEKGEEQVKMRHHLAKILRKFLAMYENPRSDLIFTAGRGTKDFLALESDKSILVELDKSGYGEWESIRKAITSDPRLHFNHAIQGISEKELVKRADNRLRMLEREISNKQNSDDVAKKGVNSVMDALIAACNGERDGNVSGKEASGGEQQHLVHLIESANKVKQDLRGAWKQELLKTDAAAKATKSHADEVRATILRGEIAAVSTVTLRAGTAKLEGGGVGDAGLNPSATNLPDLPRFRDPTMSSGGAGGASGRMRGTRAGVPKRKKLYVPEELYGVLASSIGIIGTNEREKCCNDFIALHPEYNVKEVNELFGKFTLRKKPSFLPDHEKPNNSRNKCWFYLRAHLYDKVSPEERAKFPGWEAAKEADDELWIEEDRKKKAKLKLYRDKEREKKKRRREEKSIALGIPIEKLPGRPFEDDPHKKKKSNPAPTASSPNHKSNGNNQSGTAASSSTMTMAVDVGVA